MRPGKLNNKINKIKLNLPSQRNVIPISHTIKTHIMKPLNLTLISILISISSFINAQSNFRASTAEYFIEASSKGRYTVSIGDESISSTSGRFRFFDLPEGRLPVIIEQNNKVIYKSTISIKPGMRSIAVLNRNSLRSIKELDLERYQLDNWDRVLADNYNHGKPGTGRPNPGRPYQDRYSSVMSPDAFNRFMTSIKGASFDKNKLDVLDLTVGYSYFTVDQIIQVLNSMSFSDGKLEVVRKMYPSVADPENVFQLIDSFTFSSDKEKAKAIILAGRSHQGGR